MLPNLPVLILDRICEHLSYEDVLALRCTCKGLKQFVDEKQQTRLYLFVRKFWLHQRLFYTDELIGYPHSLHTDDLSVLNSGRFREQFANLQRMTIFVHFSLNDLRENDVYELDLSSLNCFRALNHLQINAIGRVKGKLKLQELQIAAFCESNESPDSPIELDCPKLKVLRIGTLRPVLSSETDQLHYLKCTYSEDGKDYLRTISSNLRKLSTICFEHIPRLLKFLSDFKLAQLNLPSLDRIQLEQWLMFFDFDRLDELASSLEDLQRDPRKKHIQFTFDGRPIRSPGELRQIASQISAYDFEVDREDGLNNIFLTDRLNHNFLTSRSLLFLNQTPGLNFLLSRILKVKLRENLGLSEEMIKKLRSVEYLEFRDGCKPSITRFELFASTCKSLCSLHLRFQMVTESLLEMLSKHLMSLRMMGISFSEYETLKPLVKFRNLEYVHLDFDPEDELKFIFENSRTLEYVRLVGLDIVDLKRTTTGRKMHRICLDNRIPTVSFEFDTLSAMLSHYHENGLFRSPATGRFHRKLFGSVKLKTASN